MSLLGWPILVAAAKVYESAATWLQCTCTYKLSPCIGNFQPGCWCAETIVCFCLHADVIMWCCVYTCTVTSGGQNLVSWAMCVHMVFMESKLLMYAKFDGFWYYSAHTCTCTDFSGETSEIPCAIATVYILNFVYLWFHSSYLRAVVMARHKDFLVEKKRVNKCNLSIKCGSIKDVAAAFAQIMELAMPGKTNTWKFSRFILRGNCPLALEVMDMYIIL